ncbi:MAG: glycosyltransferase family 4 protein [Pirellulales bacterium]
MTRRPRKVLHVMNSPSGGAALSTLGLIEEMAREGIASCAVCHDAGSHEERQRLREAVHGDVLFTRLYWSNRKIRDPLWKRPLAEVKQILATGWALGSTTQVAQCAARWAADLVHTNTILTPEGGRAARRLHLPHVWHVRELIGPGKPFRLPHEGAAFGRDMALYCSKLIANSHICAACVRDWVPAALLEVVPNGIDLSRFHVRSEPWRREKIVVAMVGNLTSRWKKHGLFVEAATRVDRSLPIEWRLYGHDPSAGGSRPGDAYVDRLHARLAEAGIADRVRWPGFVADPAEIMADIDLLVHPADHESFGRIAVEAMAAGLPVVGVRGGGVAEIVEHGVTGLLAGEDDPADLAACVEQLARDPMRRHTMGLAGRRRAEANYSLAACAAGVLRVYEMAMQRPLDTACPTLHEAAASGAPAPS